MQLTVELSQDDIKQAIAEYVTNHNRAGMEGHDIYITAHAGSNDPREPSGGYVTATAKLRLPVQGKD